jgi:hypothetical protein
MWMLKYITCLMHGHRYASITCQAVDRQRQYDYCLQCGKVGQAD